MLKTFSSFIFKYTFKLKYNYIIPLLPPVSPMPLPAALFKLMAFGSVIIIVT